MRGGGAGAQPGGLGADRAQPNFLRTRSSRIMRGSGAGELRSSRSGQGKLHFRLLNQLQLVLLLLAFMLGGAEANEVWWTANSSWTKQPCSDLIETPPDGFVFPVRCQGPVGGLECDTVTFSVFGFASEIDDIVFDYDAEDFDTTCNLDVTKQVCGLSQLAQACGPQVFSYRDDNGETNKQLSAGLECVPTENSCSGSDESFPSCSCSGGVGDCRCVRGYLFAIRPKAYFQVDSKKVCFRGTAGNDDRKGERCVYFDVIVEPDELFAADAVISPFDRPAEQTFIATVGQEMQLTVYGRDVNEHQALTIDLQRTVGKVELPNQRWLGPTVCDRTESTTANLGSNKCINGYWRRTLAYTPREIEVGVEYSLFFAATESRVTVESYSGASVPTALTTRTSLHGSYCCTRTLQCSEALCSTSSLESKVHGENDNVKVVIEQGGIAFRQNIDLGGELYDAQENPIDSSVVYPGSPENEQRLPTAYVNCPIDNFAVIANKISSVLDTAASTNLVNRKIHIELNAGGDGFADATQYKLKTTPGPNEESLFYFDGLTTVYMPYMGVQWTPPLGSEGRDYRLCFRAFDEHTSSQLCVYIKVERCMYCTMEKDTITQVAQRFRTSWLQIWAANDYRLWDPEHPGKNWTSPESPHELDQGTLIRLGPILKTAQIHTLDEIADRFGTTVRSILQVNPDLMEMMDTDLVPRDTSLCILPEICNPTEESTS